MRTYHAGEHSQRVWDSVGETLTAIEGLDFLSELLAGSLEPRSFVNYILQDGIYLEGYARAMSLLAAKAPVREEARFWSSSAAGAIADEEAMQADLLADARFAELAAELAPDGAAVPGPTTLGYTSYLVAAAATEPYEVGVAAILPCFWIYAHMGKVLTARASEAAENVGGSAANPYSAWIEMYDSEEFDHAAEEAVAVYERLAAAAGPDIRARMEEAFRRATVYELHFWARAGALEDWTV
ncbi:TenA family protein [Brevibacterium album]|uniref:TenA family protein n=1 Tax=Brevibacterium album TaxID=417948 RepID=UPI000400ADF8|nr:TenA family protein [Brevibacterium album]